MENVKLNDGFTQVCVFEGVYVVKTDSNPKDDIKEFEEWGKRTIWC